VKIHNCETCFFNLIEGVCSGYERGGEYCRELFGVEGPIPIEDFKSVQSMSGVPHEPLNSMSYAIGDEYFFPET
jgi:hypothetical protein